MIDFKEIPVCDPRCPICQHGMGITINADNEPSNISHWCHECGVTHYIDRHYWIWKDSIYTEDQFNKALKLKAFW